MPQQRTKVFVSYSRRDAEWLERLQVHLRPLVRNSTIDLWDDTKIAVGTNWHDEIARALSEARIAVLLISADFLASDYIAAHELPRLLEAAREDGAVIVPVIVSPSRYPRTPQLATFATVNDPKRPLNSLSEADQEAVFEKVAEQVEQAIGQQELRARVDVIGGRVQDQQRQLDAQQAIINELVTYMLSAPVFRHLCGIALLREYRFHDGPMGRELYFLRDLGFIKPKDGNFVAFDASLEDRNISDLLEPTPIGWSCIRLRKADVPRDWMHDPALRHNLKQDVAAELGL